MGAEVVDAIDPKGDAADALRMDAEVVEEMLADAPTPGAELVRPNLSDARAGFEEVSVKLLVLTDKLLALAAFEGPAEN